MRIPRIYCANKLELNNEIKLSFKTSNHIIHVLRLQLNSPLILLNGKGGEYKAFLYAIEKQHAVVKITEFNHNNRESPLKIQLGQAISRGEKMDYTIQKAVELGVHKITPIFTERCNVKLSNERLEKRLQHWQAIAISACEQCGRNYIPRMLSPQHYAAFFTQPASEINLVLYHKAKQTLSDLSSKPTSVTILVGSEGGLSKAEIYLAQKHNFIPICFGPRILRTETAAMAAISILQAKWGDMM